MKRSINMASTFTKKLVLHFDLNGTVVVTDPAQRMTFANALNIYLTDLAWGKKTNDGRWLLVSETPLYHKPTEYASDPTVMNYYEYAESQVGQGLQFSTRPQFKEHIGKFTDIEPGKVFRPWLDKLLNALEWKHEKKETNTHIGTVEDILAHLQREENNKKLHFVLPAFFNFIDHLIQQKQNFSIVFRTFGIDLEDVIKAADQYFLGNHPNYLHSSISSFSPYLSSSSPFANNSADTPLSQVLPTGSTERNSEGITLVLPDCTRINSEDKIYEFFSTYSGTIGFKESYNYWAGNSWYASKAKPLFVDLSDKSVQHIFFDDGLRDPDPLNKGLEEGNSIVDLRIRNNKDEPFKSVLARDYKKFFNLFLVKVDMMESLLDLNYFINKTEECERNFNTFHQIK